MYSEGCSNGTSPPRNHRQVCYLSKTETCEALSKYLRAKVSNTFLKSVLKCPVCGHDVQIAMKLCFTICVFTTIFIYKMLLFSGKPPKFQTVSVATKVLQGSDATLYCNPQGGPPTNITWIKDDKTIDINQPNSRFSIDSSNSLLIKETQQSDEVPFTCKAVNGYGEATLTWNVDILGKT